MMAYVNADLSYACHITQPPLTGAAIAGLVMGTGPVLSVCEWTLTAPRFQDRACNTGTARPCMLHSYSAQRMCAVVFRNHKDLPAGR